MAMVPGVALQGRPACWRLQLLEPWESDPDPLGVAVQDLLPGAQQLCHDSLLALTRDGGADQRMQLVGP